MRRLVVLAFVLCAATAADAATCRIDFKLPPGWTSQQAEADGSTCLYDLRPSDWSNQDPPMSLLVFPRRTQFADAIEEVGFTRDSDDRLGIEDPNGSFDRAEKVRIGRFSGYVADTFYRGEVGHWVLKNPHGLVIAFECSVEVDCDAAIDTIAHSIDRQ